MVREGPAGSGAVDGAAATGRRWRSGVAKAMGSCGECVTWEWRSESVWIAGACGRRSRRVEDRRNDVERYRGFTASPPLLSTAVDRIQNDFL